MGRPDFCVQAGFFMAVHTDKPILVAKLVLVLLRFVILLGVASAAFAQVAPANIAELTNRALSGDKTAQYSLGEDYRLGLAGVASNGPEAERFYRMAAEQGMPEAQHALAVMYF